MAAFLNQHALAGDSHDTAPTAGGMARSAAFPSTCRCGFTPGENLSQINSGVDSDFDQSTFVNGDDYDAFATLFDIGDPGADFNHDGFVNGDDYDAFASSFDAGC